MATATIIHAHIDSQLAHLWATVTEGGVRGTVKYHATTPLFDTEGYPKDSDQLQADLINALKNIRAAQLAAHPLLGLPKTLTV